MFDENALNIELIMDTPYTSKPIGEFISVTNYLTTTWKPYF